MKKVNSGVLEVTYSSGEVIFKSNGGDSISFDVDGGMLNVFLCHPNGRLKKTLMTFNLAHVHCFREIVDGNS